MKETSNQQVPWESTSLIDPFTFSGTSPSSTLVNSPAPTEERPIIQYGKLEITTQITGSLYVDGSYLKQVFANTVFTLNDLTQGGHTIKISGDETVEKNVNINTNQTTYLSIEKKRRETPGTPCPGVPTFTDPRDGQVYPTVQIGKQCWMQKNMNNKITNSWCYENKLSNCETYGRLYNWEAALRLCPEGWHLPNDEDWSTLTNYLGGDGIAGGELKEKGINHWLYPNTEATNISGFSAIPGGNRDGYGVFNFLNKISTFWMSKEPVTGDVWFVNMAYGRSDVYTGKNSKTYARSVRCLRN